MQHGGAMQIERSSSATLKSCTISNSKALQVKRHALGADYVQRRGRHDEVPGFCRTEALFNLNFLPMQH